MNFPNLAVSHSASSSSAARSFGFGEHCHSPAGPGLAGSDEAPAPLSPMERRALARERALNERRRRIQEGAR